MIRLGSRYCQSRNETGRCGFSALIDLKPSLSSNYYHDLFMDSPPIHFRTTQIYVPTSFQREKQDTLKQSNYT